MEKEQILLQFRELYQTNFGFSISGLSYYVSDEGVKKGLLSSSVVSFEAGNVKLFFPKHIEKDSGVQFLLSLLDEFTVTEEWDDTLKALLAGRLSGQANQEIMTTLYGKRMDYLKICSEDEYSVISLIEATLTDALLVSDDKGFVLFVDQLLAKDEIEGLVGTLQTELLVDCQWLIGELISQKQSIRDQLQWLRESVRLLEKFLIKDFVLEQETLFVYQLIGACDPLVKEKIANQVLASYQEIAQDEELVATIDMFFEENLNLTDTARALFIHRNTLLYRIDKIQKITGFDLRKFSDSFIFKLAWLMKRTHIL
jgi:hypothetical protein